MPANTTPTVSEVQRAQERAVGGKKDRCVKGKSCSAACIDPNETCLVEFPDPVSKSITKAAQEISPENLDFIVKYRDDYKDRRYRDIRYAISVDSQYSYDKARNEIIEFNTKLKENGVETIKVPISWERAKKIEETYIKATDNAIGKAETAAYKGDRKAFDKEIAKLDQMHKLVGARLGLPNEAKEIDWQDYQGKPFIGRLYQANLGKNVSIKEQGSELSISTRVLGNDVRIQLSNNGTTFTFLVNNSYSSDDDMPRKEKLAIALKVKDLFSKVIQNMNEGSVVEVIPYEGDGKGDARRKAYEKFGFKMSRDETFMYGKVKKGQIVPTTPKTYDAYMDKGDFNFRELKEDVKIIYQMLWGEPLEA